MTGNPYNKISDIYDVYVQTDLDIAFFLEEVRKTSGKVLEHMVGTGRVTLPLVEAGADVTAIDNARLLLEVLRRKLADKSQDANVLEMDVRLLQFDTKFELVLIPFQAFPEITDREDQLATLRRIRAHMTDNGRFICTLHNPVIRRLSIDGHLRLVSRQPTNNGELLLWLLQTYDAESQRVTVLEFFEEYNGDGVMHRKPMVELAFNLMEKATFEELVEQAGLRVIDLYGDYQRNDFEEASSPFMIYV